MKLLQFRTTISIVVLAFSLLILVYACSKSSRQDSSIDTTNRYALSANGIAVTAYDQNGDLNQCPANDYLLSVTESGLVKTVTVSLKSPALLSSSYFEIRFNADREYPEEILCGSAMLEHNPLSYLGSPKRGVIIAAQVLPNCKSVRCTGDLLTLRLKSGTQVDREVASFKQDAQKDPIISEPRKDESDLNKIIWSLKLRGEGNQNNIFDFADFGSVGANYKKTVETTPACEPSDGNANGVIDFADFGEIGASYNKGIGGFAVYRSDNADPTDKLGILSVNSKLKGDFNIDKDASKTLANGFKEYWHTFGGSGRYIKVQLLDIAGVEVAGHFAIIDTAGGGAPAQWAMFGKDKSGSRRTAAIGPSYPKIKWEYNASSEFTIDGAAAIDANGTVYFGSQTKKFYAYKSDGSEKWTYTDSAGEITTAPAIDSLGNIYFGSVDKNLYALKSDKSLLWKFETGGEIISSPVLDENGVLYFTSGDAKIYAVNSDGKPKWSYEFTDGVDKFVGTTPAIGPDGTVYSAAEDQKLYAFKPEDGSVKWKSEADLNILATSAPAVAADGTVYVGGIDGVLTAVNHETGKTKWTFQEVPDLSIFMAAPSIDGKGNVLIGSMNKKLYCIGPDGKKQWEFLANEGIYCAPLVDGKGAVYFATAEKLLYKVNSDGNEDWHIELGAGCVASPVMANNGTIYIGCQNGSMYAITNDPNPPQVYPPNDLAATSGDYEDKIVLTWTAPTKGLAPDGYKVFRAESEFGTYTNIATLGNVLTYDDTTGVKDKTYWYYMTSLNGAKESIGSASASGYLKTAPAGRSEWWMFGGEPTHQHRSKYAGPSTPMVNKTVFFDLGDKVNTSPAIGSDGTVYSASNKVFAIRADKSLKWQLGFAPGDWFFISSPALAEDGTIYIGGEDWDWDGTGAFFAINTDGKELWRYDNGGSMSSPAIGKDGTIYVGGDYLYAFNPSNGPKNEPKWKFRETEDGFPSSPAIGADGTIYIGCKDKYLYAVNPDGKIKWKFLTNAEIYSSPSIGEDGTIYIANLASNVYAIKPDKSELWKNDVSTWQMYSSPAIAADGTIIVGCGKGYLYALNPTDGSYKWTEPCFVGIKISDVSYKGISYSCPTIDSAGYIYVGTAGGNICCVSPDGKLVWQESIVDDPNIHDCKSSPVIDSKGTLYIGADSNKIYAITKK